MKPKFDWTSVDDPPPNLTPFQKFVRDGVDWSQSPLGLMKDWSQTLRQLVLMIMANPNPAVVYWGDSAAIIYNEAYVPLIGQKHPGKDNDLLVDVVVLSKHNRISGSRSSCLVFRAVGAFWKDITVIISNVSRRNGE